MNPRILTVGRSVYTFKSWPKGHRNPAKFRVAVYRDGQMVGGARKIADAEDKARSGWWEPDAAPIPNA